MKTKSLLFFIMLFNIIIISSCKSSNEKSVNTNVSDLSVATNEAAPSASSIPVADETYKQEEQTTDANSKQEIVQERKLIKEADLEWKTNSIDNTHQNISTLAKKFDAYIADDNQYKDDYTITNRMTIKVPANKFDAFLNALNNDVKKYDRKNIKVLDVTEEYVDVAARIKTKKELEQRYLQILQKANQVEDILSVEAQLNIVRTDIEAAEARMKVLNHQISLSVINITFYETTSAPVGFFGKIGKSFLDGWNGILYFILGLITFWPFVLAIGAIVYFYRKRKAKN
jgi:hypothetical protein